MVLVRFLIALVAFIGVLASSAAVVLAVILLLRFPPLLVTAGIACLFFYGVLKRFPRIG
ncbi:hypothetical protein [Pseudomonas leptonychotis]|uniref:hypothetical protein n=1 Tax=Pseudomonas leptonychotis TaxID=2448482 RepID=UPI00142DB2A2|nr:hypothetical protein [Pseudomonas leptonychotis]